MKDYLDYLAKLIAPSTNLSEKQMTKLIHKAQKTLMSAVAWREKYHPGVSHVTVHYWMEQGKIDYIMVNGKKLVILSKKTLAHKARSHSSRSDA